MQPVGSRKSEGGASSRDSGRQQGQKERARQEMGGQEQVDFTPTRHILEKRTTNQFVFLRVGGYPDSFPVRAHLELSIMGDSKFTVLKALLDRNWLAFANGL